MATLETSFPQPQYLGSKYRIRQWIADNIPDKEHVHCVLDLFSGSQSVSYYFKQLGYEVISNDFMSFCCHIGRALVENSSETLTDTDLSILFSPSSDKKSFTLMEDLYSGLFFEKYDAMCIDNFRANVECLSSPYKRSLALTVMNRAMTRKVTMGHFAHTKALEYANSEERVKRNRSLRVPVKDIFKSLIPLYNQAVFDNGKCNESLCMNALDVVTFLKDSDKNVDLVYLDPPYCGSHADYQGFYHLLETFTEYWQYKTFVNSVKRYEPQRFSGFDTKKNVKESFNSLFRSIEDIPYWILSYNDRSYPDTDTLVSWIKEYKDVRVEKLPYMNSNGGKGSVRGSSEILFVCTPKHFVGGCLA